MQKREDMIGFVILNYCTYDDTVACISSIQESGADHRIVIVDNCSPDDSFLKLLSQYSDNERIHCIKAPSNGGFAKGNNIGITHCVSLGINHIIVTNSDVVFMSNAIQTLVGCLKENSAVIVGPLVLDERKQRTSMPIIKHVSLLQYLGLRESDSTVLDIQYAGGACEVKVVSGCCFAIDARKFMAMGAFDENTFLYHEELILSAQAEQANERIFFCPSAVVMHLQGKSTGRNKLRFEIESLKSGLYYWCRYRNSTKIQAMFIKSVKLAKITVKMMFGKIDYGTVGTVLKSYKEIIRNPHC